MAKVLEKKGLSTKVAREGLGLGDHWESVDLNIHLGYRRGAAGGSWLVRWRHEAGYRRHPLGVADDVTSSGTMDYNAARKAARDHVAGLRKANEAKIAADAAAAKILAAGPVVTVEQAVSHYIETRDTRASKRAGRQVRSDAGQRLRRYVLGQPARGKQPAIEPASIASIALHMLADGDIAMWRDALPAELKQSSQQRLINDFRAALNGAHDRNRLELAALPGTLKHGFRAIEIDDEQSPAGESQVLSDGEVDRLIAAAKAIDKAQQWEGDLYRLVLLLAATGARMSQVCRMQVCDVQSRLKRLMIPTSRKGKKKKIPAVSAAVGLDVLDVLAPICKGRSPGASLLERWRKEQVPGAITWQRGERGPWRSASELSRPWQEIRNLAGLPSATPYCFRHTSIVRAIEKNNPIRVVAAKHDTSTAMIEAHYSRWIVSDLEEMLRSSIRPMVPMEDDGGSVVVPIRPRA
ncbi:tyrosine-type recombinase/integrase [Mesorhizobium sp. M1143]|uniref:tyrosine-type recombinase/integrase n=1 Tax=Mesorhizobium sp. M1143 TaxID=2957061 RepID=UPI00333ADC63